MGKAATDDMKRAYTRVLQGHLAVASATFPHATDAFGVGQVSRKFLWEWVLDVPPNPRDGLDFGHGLGHGIGNYGAVHECRWNVIPNASPDWVLQGLLVQAGARHDG